MVRSNLKAIMDNKQLTIRQLARDIDHRPESVRQMYNDELERYPRELLTKLCKYFNVTPGELLKLEKGSDDDHS